MRKLTTILLLFISFISFSQDFRTIDWKTNVANVQLLSVDTFKFDAGPIDFNDKGAISRDIGNYFIDFVARTFSIIASDATTITVVDLANENTAPQSGRIGRVYQSVVDGDSLFQSIGGVDVSVIDDLSRWKDVARNNELFGRAISSKQDTMPFQVLIMDTTYIPDGLEEKGTSYWNEDEQTHDDVLGNEVTGQRYLEDFTNGQNDTGGTLENGTVATYAGSIGNSGNFRIEHTVASAAEHPLSTIGIITSDILNGDRGKVTTRGKVRGIQTDGANYGETWVDGIPVYKSSTIEGGLTMFPPNAPTPAIPLAIIISAHANNGTMFVRPTFPQSLTSLTDVNGTPLIESGQIMVWNQDSMYFDFDYNINNYVPDSIMDNITGAFRLWGGRIYTNGGSTIDIGAGCGIIKDQEAGPEDIPTAINQGQGAKIHVVEWDSVIGLALTDDAYNYIYFDGTDSTIKATTNFYSISFTQDFTLGRAYRDGTDVVARLCGTNAWNFNRRVQLFGEEVFPVIRGGNGLIIGEAGTLQFTITAGIIWAELVNRFTIEAYDGTITPFTYWYRDGIGGWTDVSATEIDNVNYDDGTGVLNDLIPNRYGVHWVYEVHDGSAHVIYGQDSYTLANSLVASIPSPKPGLLEAYATLVGKIVVKKNAATFYSIESAFEETFASSAPVSDHNSLSGLDGGEALYYGHLTSSEQTDLHPELTLTGEDYAQLDVPNQIINFDPIEQSQIVGLEDRLDTVLTESDIDTLYYNSFIDASIKYGYLYNWYAVDDVRDITSDGWSVPTRAEQETLISYLGGSTEAGGRIKETGFTYWNNPNTGATNESNFNGRGSGRRDVSGNYIAINASSYILSVTDLAGVFRRCLQTNYNSNETILYGASFAEGISVRPLKDVTTLSHGETGTYIGNDGRVYNTICIGTQEWLSENLAETKYQNGDAIPTVTDNTAWSNLTTGAKSAYDNDEDNVFENNNVAIQLKDTVYYSSSFTGNGSILNPIDVVIDTTGGSGVTEVSSLTTNQLTVANGTTTPQLSIITGAVVNGGTALATGDQIDTYVQGEIFTNADETDPIFTASEAFNIDATDITNLDNLSGVNTGDQDISGKLDLGGGNHINRHKLQTIIFRAYQLGECSVRV